MILKTKIKIFSKILLKFTVHFSAIFELIDLQGPMNFFRSCRDNTGPISETKICFEHVFEIGIFKGIKFYLRGKVCLVCLILLVCVCVLAGIVQLICWSVTVLLSFSFNSLNCVSGLVLLCFLLRGIKIWFALPHFAAFSTFCVKAF